MWMIPTYFVSWSAVCHTAIRIPIWVICFWASVRLDLMVHRCWVMWHIWYLCHLFFQIMKPGCRPLSTSVRCLQCSYCRTCPKPSASCAWRFRVLQRGTWVYTWIYKVEFSSLPPGVFKGSIEWKLDMTFEVVGATCLRQRFPVSQAALQCWSGFQASAAAAWLRWCCRFFGFSFIFWGTLMIGLLLFQNKINHFVGLVFSIWSVHQWEACIARLWLELVAMRDKLTRIYPNIVKVKAANMHTRDFWPSEEHEKLSTHDANANVCLSMTVCTW